MIKLTNVFKTYAKGGLALKDVSFHIAKGEFAFLTGHSGAGKSTVMKLIYADEQPSSGEVRVSGYQVTDLAPRDVPPTVRDQHTRDPVPEAAPGARVSLPEHSAHHAREVLRLSLIHI